MLIKPVVSKSGVFEDLIQAAEIEIWNILS